MSAFVAGGLVGAIMGLSVQAYWLVVVSGRPPDAIWKPGVNIGSIVLLGGIVAVGGWMLLGGLLGVLVGAIRPDEGDAMLVPSAAFLGVLVFVSALLLMPALVWLRNWKTHVFATFLLFVGLYGLLLPNLVVAAQD